MGKTKVMRKLKRRQYTWKIDQDEQDEVENPANEPEDMFDVITWTWNEKKGPHRKVWDRLLSPSLAIECQGLRKNDSSIQIEKEINLHGWKNQAGLRFLHRSTQCQKTVAQCGQVWCKNTIRSQAVIQVKRQQTDIFKHEKNQDKRKEASMAKLNI